MWPSGWYECFFHLQMVCERSDVFACSCAIARTFPIFSRRSTSLRRAEKKHVTVEIVIVGQESSSLGVAELKVCIYHFLFKAICQCLEDATLKKHVCKHLLFMLAAVGHSWKLFFCSVSLQRCSWSEVGSSDCGHTMQWNEYRSLPRCKWNYLSVTVVESTTVTWFQLLCCSPLSQKIIVVSGDNGCGHWSWNNSSDHSWRGAEKKRIWRYCVCRWLPCLWLFWQLAFSITNSDLLYAAFFDNFLLLKKKSLKSFKTKAAKYAQNVDNFICSIIHAAYPI